jgi:hypothetical protein
MRNRRAAPPARSRHAPHRVPPALSWLVFCTSVVVLGFLEAAQGGVSGFGGSATYTGQLGPVSPARTMCVCVSIDSNLTNLIGCLEVDTNGGTYFAATFNTNKYFAVAFLDLNANIGLDPGEPYVIYNDKSAPPGDPIVAGLTQNAVNFSFGDENIWPPSGSAPTPTATETPTSTLERHCPGDCDGNGEVTVGEIISLVNIALGNAQLSSCMRGDADDSHDLTINEIVAAVHAALSGCA